MAKTSRRKATKQRTTKEASAKKGKVAKKSSSNGVNGHSKFEVGAKVPLNDEQRADLQKRDANLKNLYMLYGSIDYEAECKKAELKVAITKEIKEKEQAIRELGDLLLQESVGPESKEKWSFFTDDTTFVRVA